LLTFLLYWYKSTSKVKTRPAPRPSASSAAAAAGTQFTRFTGTKVQPLKTQLEKQRVLSLLALLVQKYSR
jgi:hypothetical protein